MARKKAALHVSDVSRAELREATIQALRRIRSSESRVKLTDGQRDYIEGTAAFSGSATVRVAGQVVQKAK
jgi:hypothetical protein